RPDQGVRRRAQRRGAAAGVLPRRDRQGGRADGALRVAAGRAGGLLPDGGLHGERVVSRRPALGAPRGDGEVVAVPPLERAGELAALNRARLAAGPFAEARERARRELLALASAQASGGREPPESVAPVEARSTQGVHTPRSPDPQAAG